MGRLTYVFSSCCRTRNGAHASAANLMIPHTSRQRSLFCNERTYKKKNSCYPPLLLLLLPRSFSFRIGLAG